MLIVRLLFIIYLSIFVNILAQERDTMDYNKLTPEEERIIIIKERRDLTLESISIIKNMESILVKDAGLIYTNRKTNSIHIAAGQVLMMRLTEL